jgi:AraC family transcriptional regulator
MEPQIIVKGPIILIGMEYYGDPFAGGEGWSQENEIGRLWQRFNALWDERQGEIQHLVQPSAGYEVHVEPAEYAETKCFYVMVGVEVEQVAPGPLELSFKVLPPTTYALFTLKGPEITSYWPEQIYQRWLPGSGYEEAHKFTIERYGENFKGMDDPESELEVMVPIKAKAW